METVSIHASVKDATSRAGVTLFILIVSIHASVKDATLAFNEFNVRLLVSIHASVKDATAAYAKTLAETKFQSTHL